MATESDQAFLKKLFRRFFNDTSVLEKLREIEKLKRWGGVERWLQVEFALFLEREKKKNRIKDYERESFARMNNNNADKQRKHFDFYIKKPNGKKWLCVEFKSLKSFGQCISGLKTDWDHYFSAKKRDVADHKELYLMGVCDPKIRQKANGWNIKEIEDYIEEEYEITPLDVKRIKETNLVYFIF